VNELFSPVVSIVPTRRGRYFWAAWWSAPPEAKPFRRPDASSGGATSIEQAHAAAERAAGRPLVSTDPHWAGACRRLARGDAPWPAGTTPGPPPERSARSTPPPPQRASAWTVLGVEREATVDELKRAYRRRALETHPDRGGDPSTFRAVQRAYEQALAARDRPARRRRRG